MNEEMIGREISGCESLIMKIVWDSKEDISTPDLIDELRRQFGKDYARTTVVTFVQRLAEKGFVTTYRKGRTSYVRAVRNEKEYIEGIVRDTEKFWFSGNAPKFFAALCNAKKLSKKEIEQIRETLDGLDD